MDPLSIGLIGASVLMAIGLASLAALKGWNAWLEYKRLELARQIGDSTLPPAGGRIELADLKERVRKLEAIAAGIDYASAHYLPRFPYKPSTWFNFKWWIWAGGLGCAAGFAVLGGYLPARRASTMEPAQALSQN